MCKFTVIVYLFSQPILLIHKSYHINNKQNAENDENRREKITAEK